MPQQLVDALPADFHEFQEIDCQQVLQRAAVALHNRRIRVLCVRFTTAGYKSWAQVHLLRAPPVWWWLFD